MKKKLLAILTALACALPAVPVCTASALSWEEPTDYLITEVKTSGNGSVSSLTLCELGTPHTYTLSSCGADIEALLEGQETPEIGDIITLSVPEMVADIIPGCLHYGGNSPEYVNHGNITEIGTLEYLTVVKQESWLYTLTDEENTEYHYYAAEEYGGTPAPDLTESQTGLYYLYNGYVVLPAAEEEIPPEQVISRAEFVVIGVDDPEAPQSYIIIRSESPTAVYQLGAYQLEEYLANGGTPLAYGDIFTTASEYAFTCIWGTNGITLSRPEDIQITGSVFDVAETGEFTLTTTPPQAGAAESFVFMQGAEKEYEYPVDYVLGTCMMSQSLHVQPDGIDWTKPDQGDKLTMYTYKGVPMFPKSMERLGDADGDNEVNASDAAALLITAAENGAGLARSVTFSSDVNADGIVNAQDAASVLIYAAAKGTGASLTWEDVLNAEDAA